KVAAGWTIDDAGTAARILMRVNSPDAIEQGENAPWVAAPRARAVAKPETRNSFPTAGRQSSGLQPLMQAELTRAVPSRGRNSPGGLAAPGSRYYAGSAAPVCNRPRHRPCPAPHPQGGDCHAPGVPRHGSMDRCYENWAGARQRTKPPGPAGPGGFCDAPEAGGSRLLDQEGAWQRYGARAGQVG